MSSLMEAMARAMGDVNKDDKACSSSFKTRIESVIGTEGGQKAGFHIIFICFATGIDKYQQLTVQFLSATLYPL